MLDYDFEYDGICLSDLGFMVCSFDGITESQLEGSKITFNQTSVMMGKKQLLSNTKYEECLTTEFDICKINCNGNPEDSYISVEEEEKIRRWLNRKKFHKFKILSDRFKKIYFMGSFNVQSNEFAGNIHGMHLSFVSDAPFGYTDSKYKFSVEQNEPYTIYDMSAEEGDIFLTATITCKSSGTLEITNSFNNSTTIIRNCIEGEVISINNMIIQSSNEEHDSSIMNDFNFIFPKIVNNYNDRKNVYTFSLPCDVVFEYRELRKIGI